MFPLAMIAQEKLEPQRAGRKAKSAKRIDLSA